MQHMIHWYNCTSPQSLLRFLTYIRSPEVILISEHYTGKEYNMQVGNLVSQLTIETLFTVLSLVKKV